MNKKEKQLFKALCNFKDPITDPTLTEFATPAVLGHLFFNRMPGITYGTLRHNGLLGKINREFRNSLSATQEQNVQRARASGSVLHLFPNIKSSPLRNSDPSDRNSLWHTAMSGVPKKYHLHRKLILAGGMTSNPAYGALADHAAGSAVPLFHFPTSGH